MTNRKLTYEQVISVLARSESDEFIQDVILLLLMVHDMIREQSLHKSDFVFTQYKEGHILVSEIKDATSI
ncbi:MAG: hypothetical protein QM640_07760 [Niabella sp.]